MASKKAIGFVLGTGFVLVLAFQNCGKPMQSGQEDGSSMAEGFSGAVPFQNSLGLAEAQGNNGSSLVVMGACGYTRISHNNSVDRWLACPIKVTFRGVGTDGDIRVVAKVNGVNYSSLPHRCYENVPDSNKIYTAADLVFVPVGSEQVSFELHEMQEYRSRGCYSGSLKSVLVSVPFQLQVRPEPDFFPEVVSRKYSPSGATNAEIFVKGSLKYGDFDYELPKEIKVVSLNRSKEYVLGSLGGSSPGVARQFEAFKNITTSVDDVYVSARASWGSFAVPVDDGNFVGNKEVALYSDSYKTVSLGFQNACYHNEQTTSAPCPAHLMGATTTTTSPSVTTTTKPAQVTTTTSPSVTTTTKPVQVTTTTTAPWVTTTSTSVTTTTKPGQVTTTTTAPWVTTTSTSTSTSTTTQSAPPFGSTAQFTRISPLFCSVWPGYSKCESHTIRFSVAGLQANEYVLIESASNPSYCRNNGLNQMQGTGQVGGGSSYIGLQGTLFKVRVVNDCVNPTQFKTLTTFTVKGECMDSVLQNGVCVDTGGPDL